MSIVLLFIFLLCLGAEGKAVTVELKGNSSLGDAVGVSSAYIPLM
jgi:hypothetical protein